MGEDGQMADSYSSDKLSNPDDEKYKFYIENIKTGEYWSSSNGWVAELYDADLFYNWREILKDYHEFMQWNDEDRPDYGNMSQIDAKKQLQGDIEFVLGTNGFNDLYEREREYIKLLGMEV